MRTALSARVPMPQHGPVYCETPAILDAGFPVEPWNAYSSLVIVFFGLASLVLVIRRAGQAYELYALCALLIFNGIGSVLWHGLRARWALAFDVFPALVFLVCTMFLWSRRIFSLWKSIAVIVVFFLLLELQRLLGLDLTRIGIWVALAPAVIVVALWLIFGTAALSRKAARFGSLSLAFALAGLAFRTFDRATCAYLPFGSHFLWHILLSFAAFLGVLTLIVLTELKASGAGNDRQDVAVAA
ncbi:MAG TPA: ceramidase domain-containing protein [Rhizomicrobium sp.]|nr:ceramidase domain-containing protein [Rhizomicrobium sp.]